MRKRKDVAWVFFVTDEFGVRDLWSRSTKKAVAEVHGVFHGWGWDVGPIFRITAPKPKRRKK